MTSATFAVNGQTITHTGEDRTHLADFLRETRGLTGTHLGCEHGVCGACTLMLDGAPVRSCITYASECHGTRIRTIEDFDDDPLMAQLRAAFQTHHGLQCGFCTPGMLASAYDIVLRIPDADEARIREELSGNLCRCTGYMGIVAAIRAVLATGPHAATEPPMRPQTVTSTWIGAPAQAATHAATAQGAEAGTVTPSSAVPASISNGTTLTRVLDLTSPVDRVWAVLTDLPTVAACLPGASIDSIHENGTVDGAFGVALGPVKALFRGSAKVAFDAATRSGTVTGSGGDSGTRSRAEGQIVFALNGTDDGGSRLQIDMTYKLNGALAQFGRPRIVISIVDRLLSIFAKNLTNRTDPARTAPHDAGPPRSIIRRLLARVAQWFGPDRE
jgi:carbon-monoxide dehydrogenase small subunit